MITVQVKYELYSSTPALQLAKKKMEQAILYAFSSMLKSIMKSIHTTPQYRVKDRKINAYYI